MKRVIHIGLLLMALLGVIGQSTAMAMVPADGSAIPTRQSIEISMADMGCTDMANTSAPGKSPCKKVMLQCTAAMGCTSFALLAPSKLPSDALLADRDVSKPSLAARLWGRSYGPEPDPPSLLI